MRIAVIGQALLDVVVFGGDSQRVFNSKSNRKDTRVGGKGFNIAVAAARLGAQVELVTALGTDQRGMIVKDALNQNNIGTKFLINAAARQGRPMRSPVSSPIAKLTEGRVGERIVRVEGAEEISPLYGNACQRFVDYLSRGNNNFDALILTLEMGPANYKTMSKCVDVFKSDSHGPVICNPAPPPRDLADSLESIGFLRRVDGITPNRFEAYALLPEVGDNDIGYERVAERLQDRYGFDWCTITLGEEGWLSRWASDVADGPAISEKIVDKVGASDVFTAALAIELVRGVDMVKASEFAATAAAISVERDGGYSSFPTVAEVATRMHAIETMQR